MVDTEPQVVAKIDGDYINSDGDTHGKENGREFHYEAMRIWWGYPNEATDFPTVHDILSVPHVRFRLYDNDEILYYEGFLYNDPECIVQQFVLAWAQADSGCTTIRVKNNSTYKWDQEIG